MQKRFFFLVLLLILLVSIPSVALASEEVNENDIPAGFHKVRSITVTYRTTARYTASPLNKIWPNKEERFLHLKVDWEIDKCVFVTSIFIYPGITKKIEREDGEWAMEFKKSNGTLVIRGPKSRLDEILKEFEKR